MCVVVMPLMYLYRSIWGRAACAQSYTHMLDDIRGRLGRERWRLQCQAGSKRFLKGEHRAGSV